MVSYSIPDFHPQCAEAVNNQIAASMTVMYYYMAMASHYQNFSVALPGIYKFSEEATMHHLNEVKFLIKYQNKRGKYRAELPHLSSPDYNFGTALQALETAQFYENYVYTYLGRMKQTADSHDDYQLGYMVGRKMVTRLRMIKYVGDFITQLDRVGGGYGEFYFDYQLEDELEEE